MSDIRSSPTTTKLVAALAKAQATMMTVTKDSKNPHFRSSYASLAAVREALQPVSEAGIAILQLPAAENTLVTRIAMGDEWIECVTPVLPEKSGPQPYGSALTYSRRYALMSIFGLAPDDDDDGNAATATQQERQAAQTQANGYLALAKRKLSECRTLDDVEALRTDDEFRKQAASVPHEVRVRVGDMIKVRLGELQPEAEPA